jgi:transposase
MSRYRDWAIDQPLLLPPSVSEFVPPDHLCLFVRDLARGELDLSAIERTYSRDPRGFPPYHPAMLVALLLYAYTQGIYSSRRIAKACEERVDFMALTAMQQPDFRTISDFRKRHLEALSGLFVQVLALCRDAGIAKLGHVALDGTKVPANASRHKAMSYKRMKELEPQLAAEVQEWLERSQQTDAAEDKEHGEDRRGDELPPHALAKIRKLKQMRASMKRLEQEAQEEAKRVAAERAAKEAARGKPLPGNKPKALDGIPPDKAQSNFTDPESRIMKKGSTYVQAYNAQAAVDSEHQVIVAQSLNNVQNDVDELLPLVDQIEELLDANPREVSADSNYCSEANLEGLQERGVRGYVATGRKKHGTASPTSGDTRGKGPLTQQMRTRLKRGGHRSRYRLRKQVVEPVFGHIKECRGFRRFLLRGLEQVQAEWSLLCTAHNLLKLATARS